MVRIQHLLFFLVGAFCISCSSPKNSAIVKFKELSRPEKGWAVTHPFSIKRAQLATQQALLETEKIKQAQILDTQNNGGKLDAFRHGYWMALLTKKIGPRRACKLGKAHEKGNYRDYIKRRLEEGHVPDSISSVMDLFNNTAGISVATEHKEKTEPDFKELIIGAIRAGKFKIIARNKEGKFVDCDGNVIPETALKGKWSNNKCLVNSDYEPQK